MTRLIVLSPLDCAFYDNTRTHHIAHQLRRRFAEVVLIYRQTNAPGMASWPRRWLDFFLLRSQPSREGNLLRIGVRPFFARRDATSLALTGVADPYRRIDGAHRKLAMKLLSLAGLALDLFLIPSYLLAYLAHGAPRANVVIAQGPWEFVTARVLQLLGRVSLVAYDDLDYVPGSYTTSVLKRRAVRALESYCIRRANLVFSVGELLADLRWREAGRKALVVPNGVDLALFAAARNRRPHPPTLIYIGSVLGWAGIDLTIVALAQIRKSIRDARLLVAGHATREYQALLERLCEEHGLREQVVFLGKRTPAQLADLVAEADIGMAVFKPVELRKYAFSLKIIEYMAAGLPVITTAGTQSEQVVNKHGAGIAVDYSAESIAQAALLLFNDPKRYGATAARGVAASAAYSWDKLILDGLYPALAAWDGGATAAAKTGSGG